MLALPLIRELVLDRSVEDCFRYLADFSSTEEWDPGVFSAEKRTPGAVRVGSEFALSLNVLGRSLPASYRLLEVKPHCRLLLEGEGPGFTVTDTIDFFAIGASRTRIRYKVLMELSWAPALARGAMSPWANRLGDAAMQGLRNALELDGREHPSRLARMAERLVLPGLAGYTELGYRQQRSRGLTRPMHGRRVAITGATSGLGLAAAQLLARLGAELLLVGRTTEGLAGAAQAVADFAGPSRIHTEVADLSLLRDTEALCQRITARFDGIDVLINNAGALFAERAETEEGYERALAVNLLTPTLLAERLLPLLQARRGRVINVVSGGLYAQALHLDDYNYLRRSYDGSKAYARAKRGLLVMTQRWANSADHLGVSWQAVHPGWAATPGVAKSLPTFAAALQPWLRNSRMGANTMAWLASHPDLTDPVLNGQFWFDRAVRPDALLPGTRSSPAQSEQLQALLDGILRHPQRPRPRDHNKQADPIDLVPNMLPQ
jgi:NAD(P)-dependent dehydrogenase (short-subunit alcohol dehydrogenase family)